MKQTHSQFTPLPWDVGISGERMRDGYSQPFCIHQRAASNLIAGVFGDVRGGPEVAKANADFIATAVNSHSSLLAALEEIMAGHDAEQANGEDGLLWLCNIGHGEIESYRAALAVARSSTPPSDAPTVAATALVGPAVDPRDAQIGRLREAIKALFLLIDDGVLVRDTTEDSDKSSFLRQGLRITQVLAQARAALKGGGL